MAETLIVGSAEKIQKRHIHIGNTNFDVELYFDPHKLSAKLRKEIAQRFGARLKDGKPCLDITEKNTAKGIKGQDFSVIGFAKNHSTDDEASGSMQLYKWCEDDTKPELWVNDLCRITTAASKPKTSPLEALLRAFEDVAREAGILELHLLVENKEPEKSVLPTIYKKYGFRVITFCKLTDDDSIVMWKGLRRQKSSRTRRSATLPRAITRKRLTFRSHS